ncbi:hypothetical protein ARMGADRAFT_1026499 [Armillaria gallica]|uniref:Uncharacterized protein n=1 Tax=Armillaria gallica TaxID=47427 RepID=A0A2H3DTE5_ARMGA|nr:hypothetical protein ARMGADRAFT_1026499 [Armillaria gallica]
MIQSHYHLTLRHVLYPRDFTDRTLFLGEVVLLNLSCYSADVYLWSMAPKSEAPVGPQEMKNSTLFSKFPLNNSGCLAATSVPLWWENQKNEIRINSWEDLTDGGTDELKRLGQLVAVNAEKNITLAGMHYPDSRHLTITSLGNISDSRRKPCVDALLMLKIMDALTVALGVDEGTMSVQQAKWNPHKDLRTMLTSSRGLADWRSLVLQAQLWRTRSEEGILLSTSWQRPNFSVEEERLWCDILSFQEQCGQERKANWARIVQHFECVAWELRYQIWEKEEDWAGDTGYLFKLRQLAKAHNYNQAQWQEIEEMLTNMAKNRHSFKRQLAAAFAVSPLVLLRGVEACPPLFESLLIYNIPIGPSLWCALNWLSHGIDGINIRPFLDKIRILAHFGLPQATGWVRGWY